MREALRQARNNDEIQFSSFFNTPRTITLKQGTEISANNNGGTITIRGNGESRLTIDGNNRSGIFYVDGSRFYTGGNLNLFGMTLTNGNINNASTGGGAIYVTSGTVNLDDVIITNCTSAGRGGAIYSHRGNVYVRHSTLYNNSASFYGSAIYSYNDLDNKSYLEITDSTISGNTSPNSQGAAIYSFRTESPHRLLDHHQKFGEWRKQRGRHLH